MTRTKAKQGRQTLVLGLRSLGWMDPPSVTYSPAPPPKHGLSVTEMPGAGGDPATWPSPADHLGAP